MTFQPVPSHVKITDYFRWHRKTTKKGTNKSACEAIMPHREPLYIVYKLLSVPPPPKSLKEEKVGDESEGENLEAVSMPARLDINARRVAELYEQGFSTPRIGRMLGCSKAPVVRRLREFGIKLRGKRIDVDVERMVKLYEQGFTSRETARALSCSKSTVLRRLRRVGVKLRQNTRELPDLRPSRDLAYVLGVAFGDGGKRADGLHLIVKDKDFAEAFAKACENLGFKPRRYFKEEEKSYEVCVYSIEFSRWLKSLSYEKVERLLTDEETKKAFVEGYFDSDGCATISDEGYRNSIMFGDPNLLLLELVAKVCSDLGIEASIYGPYHNKRRSGGKSMYVLYVHARSRRRFAELVGSSLARKREALKRIARFYS